MKAVSYIIRLNASLKDSEGKPKFCRKVPSEFTAAMLRACTEYDQNILIMKINGLGDAEICERNRISFEPSLPYAIELALSRLYPQLPVHIDSKKLHQQLFPKVTYPETPSEKDRGQASEGNNRARILEERGKPGPIKRSGI